MEKIQTPEKKKNYLYHMVPDDMQGTTLYPLNQLKDKFPELYVTKSEKYKDRPQTMQYFISKLACLWNDVLHFSPVDPAELKRALVEAGFQPKELKFFQVDPDLLDPSKTTVYLFAEQTRVADLQSGDFVDYDPSKLPGYAAVSQVTRDYYKESNEAGKIPKAFVGVPHILHKGPIDISDLEVITV